MKVFVKGSKSKVERDYVVVINGDSIIWYYPDEEPSKGSVGAQSGNVAKWEKSRTWKRVNLPEHIKVAMRLCDNKNMFKLIKDGALPLRRGKKSAKHVQTE